jgi:hypothetical protein
VEDDAREFQLPYRLSERVSSAPTTVVSTYGDLQRYKFSVSKYGHPFERRIPEIKP